MFFSSDVRFATKKQRRCWLGPRMGFRLGLRLGPRLGLRLEFRLGLRLGPRLESFRRGTAYIGPRPRKDILGLRGSAKEVTNFTKIRADEVLRI